MIPDTLDGQIADIYGRLAEIQRRARNRKREGKINDLKVESGKLLYRVEFSETGGRKFIGPWMPAKERNAGSNKTHYPYSRGEQVVVVSESGDIADGEVDAAVNSDDNPRPSENSDEYVLSKVGGADIRVSGGGDTVLIEAGALLILRAPEIKIERK